MPPTFKIVQGNLPKITATLLDETGNVVNLTGCTVQFVFQVAGGGLNFAGAAVIDADPTTGKVSYTFAATQTDVVGCYQGQWRVAHGADPVRVYPTGCYVIFEIIEAIPTPAPATEFTLLSQLYDDVRALCGDFKKRLYTDQALAGVMRVQLRMGRVRDDSVNKVWTLAADGRSITPAITNTDIQAYALLVYHSAHQLVLPDVASYQYRTRAMSERFGEKKDFLFNLQNVIYELEDGAQTYADVSGLRNWLFLVNGIWVWSFTELESTIDVSFK